QQIILRCRRSKSDHAQNADFFLEVVFVSVSSIAASAAFFWAVPCFSVVLSPVSLPSASVMDPLTFLAALLIPLSSIDCTPPIAPHHGNSPVSKGYSTTCVERRLLGGQRIRVAWLCSIEADALSAMGQLAQFTASCSALLALRAPGRQCRAPAPTQSPCCDYGHQSYDRARRCGCAPCSKPG
ncbi:MAG: hypothetical protein QOG73_491, partial [Acetobacteraceae bacterium]|nr:hypothetical protein [Acetobacteraceae bacterium]